MQWGLFILLWSVGGLIGLFFKRCKVSKRTRIILMVIILVMLNILLFVYIFPNLNAFALNGLE